MRATSVNTIRTWERAIPESGTAIEASSVTILDAGFNVGIEKCGYWAAYYVAAVAEFARIQGVRISGNSAASQ